MSTDIRMGKSGQDDTSGTEPQEGAINIPQRVDNLEKRADDVKKSFRKLERDIEKFKTLAYFVVGAMAVAFTFTFILIGLDYFKNNEERYEKFINRMSEMRNEIENNYVKNVDFSKEMQEDKIYTNILNCLRGKRYWQYERCFK